MDVIGSLDEQVWIEQAAPTVTGNGFRSELWTAYEIVWTERIYGGGGEGEEANELVASSTQKFRIRYDSGVTEMMRLRDSVNNIYDIRHIEVQGRNHWMVLTTEWKDRVEYST